MSTLSNDDVTALIAHVHSKSIEKALFPFVKHIQSLLSSRCDLGKTERTAQLVSEMGVRVGQAVEQFVSAGQLVAGENPQLAAELSEACHLARQAGQAIVQQTQYQMEPGRGVVYACDRHSLVQAAKRLVQAVTRVLVLGDQATVLQLLAAKDRVTACLTELAKRSSFAEFMSQFAELGQHMVQLGQLSGERQADVKCEIARCKLAHMRSALEKAVGLQLTASKLYLRHPDNTCAQRLRADVLAHMRLSLDSLADVVARRQQERQSRSSPRLPDHQILGQLASERGLIGHSVQVAQALDWHGFELAWERCLTVCLLISQLHSCPPCWWAAADWLEYYVQTLGNMLLTSMRALEVLTPASKVAQENLDAFLDTWRCVVTNELGHLLLTVLDQASTLGRRQNTLATNGGNGAGGSGSVSPETSAPEGGSKKAANHAQAGPLPSKAN
ncbi:hypothetical protein BOX15_Mlig007255g1 [Macrostomum lignano]|uniref:Uncharacterized protein n=2 Tax=Macrostomum lignano TaxID=282301 RepID=A0A267FR21_9PLAT|nr:hypothetical protein BOX15_Mlig007255g2 [Macrostomum lignano]PAA76193.1 hypothetical protein BOX15_Mlig007255g1 [Macrostomum lignano]